MVRHAHLLPAHETRWTCRVPIAGGFHIVCPMLSRIRQFRRSSTRLRQAVVALTMVPPGTPLPADGDLVDPPGHESTRGDLLFLRCSRWDIDYMPMAARRPAAAGKFAAATNLGRLIEESAGL